MDYILTSGSRNIRKKDGSARVSLKIGDHFDLTGNKLTVVNGVHPTSFKLPPDSVRWFVSHSLQYDTKKLAGSLCSKALEIFERVCGKPAVKKGSKEPAYCILQSVPKAGKSTQLHLNLRSGYCTISSQVHVPPGKTKATVKPALDDTALELYKEMKKLLATKVPLKNAGKLTTTGVSTLYSSTFSGQYVSAILRW